MPGRFIWVARLIGRLDGATDPSSHRGVETGHRETVRVGEDSRSESRHDLEPHEAIGLRRDNRHRGDVTLQRA